ncbi:MAG: putative membrane protein, partial [Candidatus Nanohaloarchaea archaeon]
TAEKHVLARLFIDIFGSLGGMFLMKTIIIVPAVYYIIQNVDGDEKMYYLFLISVLGFAIGTRNILSFITLS